jgi:hypothetical protein
MPVPPPAPSTVSKSILYLEENFTARARSVGRYAPVFRKMYLAPALRNSANGSPVHSFGSMLGNLSEIVRNTCRRKGAGTDMPTFYMKTTPDPKQQKAYDLLKCITV